MFKITLMGLRAFMKEMVDNDIGFLISEMRDGTTDEETCGMLAQQIPKLLVKLKDVKRTLKKLDSDANLLVEKNK